MTLLPHGSDLKMCKDYAIEEKIRSIMLRKKLKEDGQLHLQVGKSIACRGECGGT
jgi:hypothetical protein